MYRAVSPSARNISTLRRSSSTHSLTSKPRAPHVADRLLFEVTRRAVIAVAAHDQEVPAQLVAGQPTDRELRRPGGTGGQQHYGQVLRQQAEQSRHLVDEGVVARCREEGFPVGAGAFYVVLAGGGVGEHAIEVEDDGLSGQRGVVPGPAAAADVFGRRPRRVAGLQPGP